MMFYILSALIGCSLAISTATFDDRIVQVETISAGPVVTYLTPTDVCCKMVINNGQVFHISTQKVAQFSPTGSLDSPSDLFNMTSDEITAFGTNKDASRIVVTTNASI